VAILEGSRVRDPRPADRVRWGTVVAVRRNPACHLRVLRIRWDDATGDEPEDLEELEFGALED
jgi:hypothetical protein